MQFGHSKGNICLYNFHLIEELTVRFSAVNKHSIPHIELVVCIHTDVKCIVVMQATNKIEIFYAGWQIPVSHINSCHLVVNIIVGVVFVENLRVAGVYIVIEVNPHIVNGIAVICP